MKPAAFVGTSLDDLRNFRRRLSGRLVINSS
jgi:hypothetical protein